MVEPRSAAVPSTSDAGRLGASLSSNEPEWTDQVTDLIVDLVDSARDKTTGPILTVSRGVVYGIVILGVVTILGVAATALGGRLISLIPIPVWISYAAIGLVFVIVGAVCWKKRVP